MELALGTPDHHEIILELSGGLMLSMHFDLVDRTHERQLRIATTTSTMKWSNLESCIRVFNSSEDKWNKIDGPYEYDYEQCYQAEIKQFLTCIETGDPWPIPIEAAEEVVRVLLALSESSKSQQTIRIGEAAIGRPSNPNS